MQTAILVIVAIASGAIGNLLIKLSSKGMPETLSLATFGKMATNPMLLLGILFLAGSFPAYSLVLQRLPLSLGFPLVQNLAFVTLLILSYFFLKESLTFVNLLGILLLIVGLFLAASK
jgi:multidrug transporter EmrE-like cation transporter